MYKNLIFLIHSSVVGYLNCFQSLTVVNNVAIYMGVKVSLLYPDLYSFGYLAKSITRSYGNSIFSFLTYLHTVFHYGCTNLHSPSVPVSLYPGQYLLLFNGSRRWRERNNDSEQYRRTLHLCRKMV
jgi:hypothetical protein